MCYLPYRWTALTILLLCFGGCVFWCDSMWPEFCAVLMHQILMTVLYIHLFRVHSLTLSPQCRTFHTHAHGVLSIPYSPLSPFWGLCEITRVRLHSPLSFHREPVWVWRMSGLTYTPLPSSMSRALLMVQLYRGGP